MKVKKLEIKPVTKEFDCGHKDHLYINGKIAKRPDVYRIEYSDSYNLYDINNDRLLKEIIECSFSDLPNNITISSHEYFVSNLGRMITILITNKDKLLCVELHEKGFPENKQSLWDTSFFQTEFIKRMNEKISNMKNKNYSIKHGNNKHYITFVFIQKNRTIKMEETIKSGMDLFNEIEMETQLHFLNLAAKELKRINKEEKNKSIK